MNSNKPFWPRVSPHFLACRRGVRTADLDHAVAVGLSGGADSLALMAALVAEGHDVLALCVDHGLQDGSRAQAERAAEQARTLGARAQVLSVEAGAGAAAGAESMEAAARAARYRALAAACADEGLEVAVAHTADDQAETLLLGALRGRVTGMSERSEVEGARVVRPLLGVRRADTEGACAELGLSAWQDPQNADTNFRRVALRRAGARLARLDLAVLGRRARHERVDQLARGLRDDVDGALVGGFVGARRLGRAADLAHVLQGCGTHLLVSRGGREVVERADVAAHA